MNYTRYSNNLYTTRTNMTKRKACLGLLNQQKTHINYICLWRSNHSISLSIIQDSFVCYIVGSYCGINTLNKKHKERKKDNIFMIKYLINLFGRNGVILDRITLVLV